jgi:hypothetical protein
MYVISDQGELVTRYDERLLLSTKLSFMYTPGSGPVTFEAGGLRLGARWASRSLPGVFAEYEHLDIAGVLICAGPGQTPAGRRLRGQAQAHAAPTVHQVTDGGASAARMRDTAQVALSGPRPRFRAAQIYETSSLLWCMARAAN